ncbi:ZIP family metal transporter [Ramlibacter sp. Leaf400]|uniref:ZIP family metal transporter n=1 Tax=Ramlibacter sp. Leaf400 TaxID=1736365 RepID=UPI0006FC86B1|nr:zinc/iron permease [Ramlibacter sp. Leaf400]KQT11535.1 zinc/iron permease [Ramlibacter sp. Leaf400]
MDFTTLLLISLAGALASPLGGALALCRKPTTLALSIAVGFAAGALLGAFAFEMLPKAAETASLPIAVAGFAAGFGALYALDLFLHHGVSAGEKSSQWKRVVRLRHKQTSRGDGVTLLAGGTSAEELVEGLTIGVSAATDATLGLIVGLAIVIDNASEAMSIGDLIQEQGGEHQVRRILGWTGLIGASLFVSAMAGWFLLRDLSPGMLGFLLAVGAGAMFYLTMTELVPEAESHQFQQSSAVAAGVGLLVIFTLSRMQ